MRLPRTVVFDEESVRFELRFCCEDCGHFDRLTQGCAHGWPSELHRRQTTDEAQIDFCKEFELC